MGHLDVGLLVIPWMGIPWALAILFARREWRAIPVENRRFQIRLSELLVAPLILTPGLAALGRGSDLIFVAFLFTYPVFGAVTHKDTVKNAFKNSDKI